MNIYVVADSNVRWHRIETENELPKEVIDAASFVYDTQKDLIVKKDESKLGLVKPAFWKLFPLAEPVVEDGKVVAYKSSSLQSTFYCGLKIGKQGNKL